MRSVRAFAPATIANLGPGFDVFGLAVRGAGDVVEAARTPRGVTIASIVSPVPLPRSASKNTAGIAAREVLRLLGNPGGVELKIWKGLPSGSGLGSSAASAAAAAHAVNVLYGSRLSKTDLIAPATAAEAAVAGGYHADNTSAALLGGATLVRSVQPLDVLTLRRIPENLLLVLCTPEVTVLTREARKVLPERVPLAALTHNVAHASSIAVALSTGDYTLFSTGLKDIVIEPARARLIPAYLSVTAAAKEAGADSVNISGSGPTLFAITNGPRSVGEGIGNAMRSAFLASGIRSSVLVTVTDRRGARTLKR